MTAKGDVGLENMLALWNNKEKGPRFRGERRGRKGLSGDEKPASKKTRDSVYPKEKRGKKHLPPCGRQSLS